ncbi:1768_t:CDS:2 [Racocetra persica]|uniref:1768_t:CDS:1 n=1 Tax=Racocetra persica TaxID=160502 RepID=A0ACA9MN66_9GLOM|nr:1768_t:CDS:2 [Racocetra persica]
MCKLNVRFSSKVKLLHIFKYRDKIIQEIYKFAETAGVESIEINEAIKEAKEDDANFREFAKDKDT